MAKILIIDASPFMRGSLKFLSEHAGHVVIGTADNAKDAEELYMSNRPDIVTLDITMDNNEGLLILRKLKHVDPNVKVIVASASGQKEKILQGREIGTCGLIEKPYKYEQISAQNAYQCHG